MILLRKSRRKLEANVSQNQKVKTRVIVQNKDIWSGLWVNISQIMENSRLLDAIISFQGIFTYSVVCFGLSMIYFAQFTIFSISTFLTVSVIYSRTCSAFHF